MYNLERLNRGRHELTRVAGQLKIHNGEKSRPALEDAGFIGGFCEMFGRGLEDIADQLNLSATLIAPLIVNQPKNLVGSLYSKNTREEA